MANIIFPKHISFFDWASQQSFAEPLLNWPVPPKEEKAWRGWATIVVFLDNRFPTPCILVYPKDESWRDWASIVSYIL